MLILLLSVLWAQVLSISSPLSLCFLQGGHTSLLEGMPHHTGAKVSILPQMALQVHWLFIFIPSELSTKTTEKPYRNAI